MTIGTPTTATTILTWDGLAPETHLYRRPKGEMVGAVEITVTLCVRQGRASATVGTKFRKYRTDRTFAVPFGVGVILASDCPGWVQPYIDAATQAHLDGIRLAEQVSAQAA